MDTGASSSNGEDVLRQIQNEIHNRIVHQGMTTMRIWYCTISVKLFGVGHGNHFKGVVRSKIGFSKNWICESRCTDDNVER